MFLCVKMSKKLLYLVMIILLSNIALAASVHGTIYSFDLEKRENAIVSVNSVPPQTLVAKDGTYDFELDVGEYNIISHYTQRGSKESVEESFRIEKQGRYVLDLILFPSFEDEEELLKKTEEPIIDDVLEEKTSITTIVMFIIAIIGLGFIVYIFFKYKKDLMEVHKEVQKTAKEVEKNKTSNMAKENKEVIDFIKKKGGRVTQKEIRKNFPSSEAKVSLIISDLEDKKVVKKIKQGRGNIIVLK